MKLLDCTLRLGEGVTHSVPKHKITELELMLLKHIHGDDAIADLKQVGEIHLDNNAEYRKLARYYSVKNVETCFDIKLDNFSDWLEDQLDAEKSKRFEEKSYNDSVEKVKQKKEITEEQLELNKAKAKTKSEAKVDADVEEEGDFAFDGEGNPITPKNAEPVVQVIYQCPPVVDEKTLDKQMADEKTLDKPVVTLE